MKLYLKYCGGCNPLFDRSLIVQYLRRDMPHVELTRCAAEANLAAVICGCRRACAGLPEEYTGLKAVYVCDLSEYDNLKRTIGEMEQ